MSLGASGQLGKALVFFAWKGLNVVREHVTPSNPQTAAQTTQRAYVTAAVAAVHTAQGLAANPLDSDDQVAYSALASAKNKIMTWFNQVVKLWCDVKVDSKVPIIYRNGRMIDTDADDFRPRAEITEETSPTLAAGKFYVGTSKTNLVTSKTPDTIGPDWIGFNALNGFSGLTAGVKYYWQFRPDAGDGAEGADSGIYYAVAT